MTAAAELSNQGLHVGSGRMSPISGIRGSQFSVFAFCAGLLFSCRSAFVLITARWLNVGSEPGILAGFVMAAATGLIAALGAFGARHQFERPISTSRQLRWIAIYLTFSGCSLFWSASVSVGASFLYWLSLLGDVAIVILLVRGEGPDVAVRLLLKGFIAGSCVLAAMAWLMPVAADLRLGDLEYFNTNQIGNLCALSVIMCSLLTARGSPVWRLAPWFLAITLLRSLSKATIAAIAACLLYGLIRGKTARHGRTWFTLFTGLVLTLAFWGLFSAYYGVYTTAGNQAETLTGRTEIWAWTLDAGLRSPWIGNGFDAMWRVAPVFNGSFEARHAENELLQQFFAYGICGVVMLFGVYGSLYRGVRSRPRGPERIAMTSFLIYAAVRGVAEAEPFDLLLPLWLITAFALLLVQDGKPQEHQQMEAVSSVEIKSLPMS